MSTGDVIESSRMSVADFDTRMMQAAIALGRRGLGLTAPNPAVGAIVVREGRVIGRGFTAPGGRPHAETEALRVAGEAARGATLYVSLEPCSHHGKTPPCADAIVAAGIARVVSSLDDPDPRVAGRGYDILRKAGIEVVTGVCVDAARRTNLGHVLRVTAGRPMVTLKLAETADGYAAGDRHDARLMITGQAANNRTQMMRAMHDAIMVGIGTVIADDPLMTVRLPGVSDRRPLRVVLDTHLQLPLRSRLVQTARQVDVLVIAGPDASADKEAVLRAADVDVVRVAMSPDGRAEGHIDIEAALRLLAQRNITRVFSEGGPRIAAALIAQGLADEVVLFTSPKPLGREGVAALSPQARAMLGEGSRFRRFSESLAGTDRLRIFERIG